LRDSLQTLAPIQPSFIRQIAHRDMQMTANEKEISHGTVLWQTRRTYFALGPVASSAG